MKTFYVEWSIDITAESHEDAARKALEIQRDPTSIATVFEVIEDNETGFTTVDLTALDEDKA